MRKNLLIGAVTNYIWDDIAPFFNSYMQAGFENCDCVMFTGNMSEATLDKMRSCGVDVRPIPEECLNGDYLNGIIVFYRFKLFYDFINERRSDYDMVLTADIRDVFFQRDLFKLCDASKPFLGIALEDKLIGECPFNTTWIRNGYDEETYRAIKDKNAICMGTIWGTCSEFLRFIGEIIHELETGKAAGKIVNDQGSGNVILHTSGKFDDVMLPSANDDGCVMTIGETDSKALHTDSSGNVLNGKGQIAAVIHQYDRQPAILDIVVKKYTSGMSAFSRTKLKHTCDSLGRVMRFMSRSHRQGFFHSALVAIKHRI